MKSKTYMPILLSVLLASPIWAYAAWTLNENKKPVDTATEYMTAISSRQSPRAIELSTDAALDLAKQVTGFAPVDILATHSYLLEKVDHDIALVRTEVHFYHPEGSQKTGLYVTRLHREGERWKVSNVQEVK